MATSVRHQPRDPHTWSPGWRALTFRHDPNSVSSVGSDLDQPRLATYTAQPWAWQLLPEGYRAQISTGQAGGLQGDLAIILALGALSAPPQHVASALDASFKIGRWREHQYGSDRKLFVSPRSYKLLLMAPPIGQDERGVVVTVYVGPSSANQLWSFENGLCGGPIFA